MNISNVLRGLYESNLNLLFCLFILSVALRAFYVHTKPLIRISNELEKLTVLIKGIDNIPDLIETLEQKNVIGSGIELEIQEFCEGLKRKEIDIDKYFSLVNIIEIPSKRKKAELVPGILTALGILGTFLGLLIGLSELNTTSNDNLTASVGTVINGMTLAFWTSIFGILSSLIWNQIVLV